MPEPTLLLTGFGAFPGVPDNPTAHIVHALNGESIGGWRICGAVLPVGWVSAAQDLRALVADLRPQRLVHLGVATRRRTLCLERRAANCLDFRVVDTSGSQPRQQPIDPHLPRFLSTRVAVDGLVQGLRGQGVPARASSDAGLYVCNATYFQSLHLFADLCPLFVHVPGTRGAVTVDLQAAWIRALIGQLPP